MTVYETLSILIALVAVVIAALSWRRATKANNLSQKANELSDRANKLSEQSNKISEATIETSMLSAIRDAKQQVYRAINVVQETLSKNPQTEAEKKLLETHKHIYESSLQDSLNAYEDACAKYIDNKIDKERFTKNFKTEIRQLFESTELSTHLHPINSKYRALRKVYDEWENLEK